MPGCAALRSPSHRHRREHQSGSVRSDDQHWPSRFYGDSLRLDFLLRQQRPKLCRSEREHGVLQSHHGASDDGGQIRLGNSSTGVGSFIWTSANHSLFSGNSSNSFFFVRPTAHNLFDHFGGAELSPCLGPWSRTRKIAFWKVMRPNPAKRCANVGAETRLACSRLLPGTMRRRPERYLLFDYESSSLPPRARISRSLRGWRRF
jgi:hypothetical protein